MHDLQLIQSAHGPLEGPRGQVYPPQRAILQIDGYQWTSPVPVDAGEAESFNNAAEFLTRRCWIAAAKLCPAAAAAPAIH